MNQAIAIGRDAQVTSDGGIGAVLVGAYGRVFADFAVAVGRQGASVLRVESDVCSAGRVGSGGLKPVLMPLHFTISPNTSSLCYPTLWHCHRRQRLGR